MASTFAGLALYNSGPHRFVIRSVGRLFLPAFVIDELQTDTAVFGPRELAIIQTGRLVATTDAALWSQVDLIRQHAEAALTGDLVEGSGRTWMDMTLLRFQPDDRVDRGRDVSLGYRADYIELNNPPS